jgi:hypothetical protein
MHHFKAIFLANSIVGSLPLTNARVLVGRSRFHGNTVCPSSLQSTLFLLDYKDPPDVNDCS